MVDKTEIIISVMPKLESKIIGLSSRLEQIMAERAPEAWDAALGVIQVNGVTSLISTVSAIILIAACLVGFHFSLNLAFKQSKNGGDVNGIVLGIVVITAVIGVIGAGRLAFDFITGNFVWPIVAIAHPELVIAKRILDGIL